MITFLQLLAQQLYWEIDRKRDSGAVGQRAKERMQFDRMQAKVCWHRINAAKLKIENSTKFVLWLLLFGQQKSAVSPFRKPHFMIVNVRILCIHTYRPINTWCFYGNVVVCFASWGAIFQNARYIEFCNFPLANKMREFQLIHLMTQNVESIG